MGTHEPLFAAYSPMTHRDLSVDLKDSLRANIHLSSWEPEVNDEWTAVTRQAESANIAHAPQWFVAIKKAYKHTPLYLQARNDAGQCAVLPAFLIRSHLFGSVVTSMPFLDTGGPCSSSAPLSLALIDSLVAEAKCLGASRVELRCAQEMNLSVLANTEKVNLVLPLPHNPDALWKQFNAKVRNQIRKAERSGLSVEFGGKERLDEFYQVFTVNMRDLGSPVHAKGFFAAIFDAFGKNARLTLVRKGAVPVGGLIALAFKDTLVVPWASCLREYFSLCPNMLLYWETIRAADVEGFQRFDFGRSSRNSGTHQFKRQWGAMEEPLFWYTIELGKNRQQQFSQSDKGKALFTQLWSRLPLPVTCWVGPRIRKYLTL